MKLLCKIFKLDPDTREGKIAATSALGIIANVFIAIIKIVLGALTSSIAIISEGINNGADALTSVLTLAGTKLAGKKPDEKHPFGYGRIEYLTGLVVAVIILVAGIESLISSVKLVFNPEELKVNYLSLIIVAITGVIKFALGSYTIKMGRTTESKALEGVGAECRSDSFASILTIASALVFLILGVSVDAYAGIIISVLIIKAGCEVLFETVSELIGRPGEKELAQKLYGEIRKTPGILAAADMMLHNYGPDAWSGSVNVEIDHSKTVEEVYAFLHKLQLRIMHEYKVTMVFGIYAVDNDHEEVRELRKRIAAFVRSHEHVSSYHAVYIEPDTGNIYCDFIVDYKQEDWEGLEKEFKEYMAGFYKNSEIILTIETEFV